MRVLIIKMSSMGDLIHTFPALTDAANAIPDIEFDWLVEEGFASIPTWHPQVKKVIPVAWRRWRKALTKKNTHQELRQFLRTLRQERYDYIIDAQGLAKSAFFAVLARGCRIGLNWRSARESIASLVYRKKCNVNFYQHAILRMRQLFSLSLNYDLPDTLPDADIGHHFAKSTTVEPYIVFLPGTTWASKAWPESYWQALATTIGQAGYRIKISGGNVSELAEAARIATASAAIDLLPRLSIQEMADLIASSCGVVSVDTGFGHLAAALDVPTVSIYGATNPLYTGAIGKQAKQVAAHFVCSPCLSRSCVYKGESVVKPACYQTVPPVMVWSALNSLINKCN